LTLSADLRAELQTAPLRVTGRFADASNLTLLAETAGGLACVYKPVAGERPLWDFPTGTLAGREVAMSELADAVGWDVVPLTVLRADGPHGPGVCQRYVEASGEPVVDLLVAARPGWLMVAAGEDAEGRRVVLAHRDRADLRQLALLDAIANNADRKGGHLLRDAEDRLWGIDHGLTFHTEDKLRTVLWGFAGDPIDAGLLHTLQELAARWETAAARLAPYLAEAEAAAAAGRLAGLLADARFPAPEPGWPRLPWPPL
jgi:uncharacterized repeat protein (TIGR03843 family)